uniref:Condensation domain-containing protein n=1 Tax=Heterorhabditis bacteriophora TaxID=37862 RepID=A0A1I7WS50_HETBA
MTECQRLQLGDLNLRHQDWLSLEYPDQAFPKYLAGSFQVRHLLPAFGMPSFTVSVSHGEPEKLWQSVAGQTLKAANPTTQTAHVDRGFSCPVDYARHQHELASSALSGALNHSSTTEQIAEIF